ncbi:MAG: trypsin-like peptidase domain-containing protein [Promicromonosporaceae bacterium]|nr:trypsin-like peptidase domain-containing protein [Promicromonosporaceae bacterium]
METNETSTPSFRYHAPVHHKAIYPPVAGVVLESEATTRAQRLAVNRSEAEHPLQHVPNDRLPTHPAPVHHRPIHVTGMEAARQIANQQFLRQGPPLPPQAPPGYGPPNRPVGGPPTQPVGPPVRPAVAPRTRSSFPAILLAAFLASVLSSIGTVAVMSFLNPAPHQTVAAAPAQVITINRPDPGRVDAGIVEGSTVTNPYWQGVHSAVLDSVVAIQASLASGGSVGSGFILDRTGHVVTNNHVVDGAEHNLVQVTLADGRLYHAEIIGGDATTDLAVLRLQDPPADLQPAALGDSDLIYVGDPIMALGNPLGLANTATVGIISAMNRPVTASGQDGLEQTITNAIQIDAAINPGNSGGPLFDHLGRVIGVTSSIASLSSGLFGQTGSIGLGFAIPVNLAKGISSQLIENGVVEHARLGVRLLPVTVNVDGISRRGAQVESVVEGTAAALGGLVPGDVVIAFNGLPVSGPDSLTAFVRERRVGDQVVVQVARNGSAVDLPITLGALIVEPVIDVPQPDLTLPPDYEEGGEVEEGNWQPESE